MGLLPRRNRDDHWISPPLAPTNSNILDQRGRHAILFDSPRGPGDCHLFQ
jgi:hypothetical protein